MTTTQGKRRVVKAKPRRWGNTPTLRLTDIRQHDCKRSSCGPVCTFGEW